MNTKDLKFEVLSPRMQTGDATGEKHGRLTVLGYAGKYLWWCKCECGNITQKPIGYLRSGNTTSCGCWRFEVASKVNTTHGYFHHKEYVTWQSMKKRCLNPKNPRYKDYGGRGIKIYKEWAGKDPRPFCDWIDQNLGPRPKDCTLDRIDNDGHYEPGNLRWATISEQAKNQRRHKK